MEKFLQQTRQTERIYRKELPGPTKPSMVGKNGVRNCHNCKERLRLPHSKKPCEICGKVYCKSCCKEKVPLAHKKLKEGSVCNSCYHEGIAYAHVLIIFLRCLFVITTKCCDCGKKFNSRMKKYGCLTCEQTFCDRCIPMEAIDKGDVVLMCRRCKYRENPEEGLTILRIEEKMKVMLIKLIFQMADIIDIKNTHINVAETTLSAVGLVSGSVAVIGFGLSFVTFGASLALTIAGSVVGGATGIGQVSTQISWHYIKEKAWTTLKKICARIQEIKEKRWQLDIASTAGTGAGTVGSVYSATQAGVKLANVGDDVTAIGQAGSTVTKIATKTTNASKTLFSSLGKTGKVFHIGGVVFSAAGMGFDIYTIIDRSIRLHKKKPAETAEIMRRLAYRVIGPIPHLPSTCERRVVDRELFHQMALF